MAKIRIKPVHIVIAAIIGAIFLPGYIKFILVEYWKDNVKTHTLTAAGYTRTPQEEKSFNAQEDLIRYYAQ